MDECKPVPNSDSSDSSNMRKVNAGGISSRPAMAVAFSASSM